MFIRIKKLNKIKRVINTMFSSPRMYEYVIKRVALRRGYIEIASDNTLIIYVRLAFVLLLFTYLENKRIKFRPSI
jgi:hypothetical protein